MENNIIQPAMLDKLKDNRAEWITPAIVDYDIEESTRSSFAGSGSDNGSYS